MAASPFTEETGWRTSPAVTQVPGPSSSGLHAERREPARASSRLGDTSAGPYPHRYGDTDRAVEHYATACAASARILRSEGRQLEAAELEAEAGQTRHQLDHSELNPMATELVQTATALGPDDSGPVWWR
jgi:hypothetical protein